MNLNWTVQKRRDPFAVAVGDTTEFVIHFAEFDGDSDEQVEAAINACIDRASALLDKNVHDNSMFLLFEWDPVYSILTIVVTDSSKERDSTDVVKCSFPAIDTKMQHFKPSDEWERKTNDYAEDIQFWIKDYLATCTSFLGYSLVAAFHKESRDKCVLL